jgi:hypothetical protein
MIAMGMGDHGFVHRLPGIDVEPSLFAKKTFIGEFN